MGAFAATHGTRLLHPKPALDTSHVELVHARARGDIPTRIAGGIHQRLQADGALALGRASLVARGVQTPLPLGVRPVTLTPLPQSGVGQHPGADFTPEPGHEQRFVEHVDVVLILILLWAYRPAARGKLDAPRSQHSGSRPRRVPAHVPCGAGRLDVVGFRWTLVLPSKERRDGRAPLSREPVQGRVQGDGEPLVILGSRRVARSAGGRW